MAIPYKGTVPYAPAIQICAILNRARSKGLQSPVTPEVLQRCSVPDSLVPRTMQALMALELIDESGQTTETLNKIRLAPEKDYRTVLAEWVRGVYATVFQYVDPEVATPTEIRDAFRTFEPQGQQPRMVSLFIGLCAEAGLATGPLPSETKPRVRSESSRGIRRTEPARKDTPTVETPPPPANRPAPPVTGIHPALAGLLTSLPGTAATWSKADRDKFLKTFEAILDFAHPAS